MRTDLLFNKLNVWAPPFHFHDYAFTIDPNSVGDIGIYNSQVVTHQISEFYKFFDINFYSRISILLRYHLSIEEG